MAVRAWRDGHGLGLALVAALIAAPGCAYLRNRGRDTLDLLDVGLTFTKKPQFGLYANCPFIAPGGYAKVDGYYAGVGGGKVGLMEHHQDTAGLLLWGRENVSWGDEGTGEASGEGPMQVGPLGIGVDNQGQASYKPQCAHYLHLGFVGVTGNLNYKEWPDFFVGWVGLDPRGDDNRDAEGGRERGTPSRLAARPAIPRQGLLLLVRSEKDSYAMDEPIVLEVQLVNCTGRSRSRGDRPRDLSVYFEPFAMTPQGAAAEWLFKFLVLEDKSQRARYTSPRFELPAQDRDRYYHYAKLAPSAFIGRHFVFPPASARNWLRPGRYTLQAAYEVADDCTFVIVDPGLTSQQAKALGADAAYERVWTGRVHSNTVSFSVERNRVLGLF